MKTIVINSWSFLQGDLKADKLGILRLTGFVYGHPRYKDGSKISTAALIYALKSVLYTASGTEYLLGTPSAEQEQAQPGSRAELLKQLGKYAELAA